MVGEAVGIGWNMLEPGGISHLSLYFLIFLVIIRNPNDQFFPATLPASSGLLRQPTTLLDPELQRTSCVSDCIDL